MCFNPNKHTVDVNHAAYVTLVFTSFSSANHNAGTTYNQNDSSSPV